jgi:Ni,Fe-hydrogenase III component G
MTKYLVSFDDGAMTFPEEEPPAVAEAAPVAVREAEAVRTVGIRPSGSPTPRRPA